MWYDLSKFLHVQFLEVMKQKPSCGADVLLFFLMHCVMNHPNVAHMDAKPENILIDEKKPKGIGLFKPAPSFPKPAVCFDLIQ